MTETEQKALALIAEVKAERGLSGPDYLSARAALIRAIEQHEQFKREVSDAVEAFFEASGFDATKGLIRFILPKPVDPLVEAIDDLKDGRAGGTTESYAACLRAALAKRGGKIVWENEP